MKSLSELSNLSGKIALVTGGAGYLGSAMVETLAELGASIVIASRDLEKCKKKAQEISKKFNTNIDTFKLDILEQEDINALVLFLEKKYKKLDILINNAIALHGGTLESITKEDWNFDINHCLNGAFFLTQKLIPLLKKARGNIINIASMYGHTAPDYRIYNKKEYTNPPSYGVAKAGIIQFSRYLASFLSPYGIRANTISPGAFPFGEAKKDGVFINNLSQKSMLGRIGDPGDIKGAILLLATDLGKYITAQNICIDGGWTEW